ncbi:MAG: hypothetical protein ACLQU3_00135 [Limisphaerales bacterium]
MVNTTTLLWTKRLVAGVWGGAACVRMLTAGPVPAQVDKLAGQPADIAPSAYLYRADRPAEGNPPEAWILLMQHANLPFDQPVNTNAPEVKRALCGLLWEEVRPLRRLVLSWPREAKNKPAPDELGVSCFNGQDDTAHTWWNPRTVKEAAPPEVSADGCTYSYVIPVDTWGVMAAVRGPKEASAFAVPALQAFVTDEWKQMDVELEWAFEPARAALPYDGRIEAYDGRLAQLQPLREDKGTQVTTTGAWRSPGGKPEEKRRGVRFQLLYIGESRWRRIWPYHAQAEDVARTIVTVWTKSGSFSFLAADLEHGPILAPEYGFFVRAAAIKSSSSPAISLADAPPPRELLRTKVDAIPGVPLVRGWSTGIIPWFGANPSNQAGIAGDLRIPARCVAMHPLPDRDVAVGWHSPLQGRVSIGASIAMGDAHGGNGIEWTIVRDTPTRRSVLAHGDIGPGGSQLVPGMAKGDQRLEAEVESGDMLSLVVGAKEGDHFCDTTIVGLIITEAAPGGRTWDLTREVVDSIHAANPHPDGVGHPDVWHFYSQPAAAPPPQPSQPPFDLASQAKSAREFMAELGAKRLSTIRQRTRVHEEPTWLGAVTAMRGTNLPPLPKPPFMPAMEVDLPSQELTAQWNLGAWHLLRHSARDAEGRWRFNDFPFGILASETYMILRALDLQGMHQEAADGLDQWLSLPLQPGPANGTHPLSKPDRPLGHFSDGLGCLTHAVGPDGAGGHMDAVHSMGPGAIMFALAEHFRLTGDLAWLKANAPRMKANAEWILRQRRLLANNLPAGQRLWSKGLQPAHVVTPDSLSMHMQFYETEAYYWLGVKSMAEILARLDPAEGARMAGEAEAYRQDLVAAIDRSIALTPVVAVRDGTYHSFIPFAPYVRGFAAGAWGWRRCQGHVGAIYWDTVQSADPLISPAGLLSPDDPRVQGHLDVLEDRLLLENEKVAARTPGFDAEKDWFAHASWQYQCGLERHANIHLADADAPNFLRSMLNQYAVDIMPGEYTFREHTTTGPPDKLFEESCFLERFRMMLVMEEGDVLWLARATPRAWLEQGKRIAVRNAPTHFGPVGYEIVSDVGHEGLAATVTLPSRNPPLEVVLVLRHPTSAAIAAVKVNGQDWTDFDAARGWVKLHGLSGQARVEVKWAS